LIQLRDPLPSSEEDVEALKESLRINMAVANKQAPAHGQLHKDYIMFATEEKPFILAGKGTVLRPMTVQLYEKEINDFYATQESRQSSEAACLDVVDLVTSQSGIEKLLSQILLGAPLTPDDDFFVAGLDSLSVFKVLASLRATLRSVQLDEGAATPAMIYSNPTIKKLAEAFNRVIRPDSGTESNVSTVQLMNDLLDKYISDLPKQDSSPAFTGTKFSVILTGSTGSLGSYLLDDLLSNSCVEQIFCLNRTADAKERQISANNARGLGQDLASKRVKFIQADLSKPNFGLSGDIYNEMIHETTHIIRRL
jgi:aryl carrier-like protein